MKLIQNKYIQVTLLILLGLVIGIAISNTSDNTSTATEDTHEHQGLWSCSMHPQIVSETPGSCPICGMDLTPMVDNDSGLDPNALVLTENAAKAAQLTTYILKEADQTDQTIELSGTLVANQDLQFKEISYVSGRIDFLAFPSAGVELQKGDLIAKLYSPELIAAQQELISLSNAKESESELFEAVVQKFKNWNFNTDQINSIIENNTVEQSYPIYAKESGTIIKVSTQQGEWIKAGQSLLNSVDLSTIWASIEVYETNINQFKKGQKIELSIEALANAKRTARIDFVDPVLDTNKRIGTIRASLNNSDNQLKPGMFIKVIAQLQSKEQSLRIPASAVLWTGKKSLVYVKSPTAPTYSIREVSLMERQGEWYSISSGLQPGEEIVQNGTFVVDAAAQLAGKTSMINQ